jgi:hypothetical protein
MATGKEETDEIMKEETKEPGNTKRPAENRISDRPGWPGVL